MAVALFASSAFVHIYRTIANTQTAKVALAHRCWKMRLLAFKP